jgi:putative DNA primase/helicase
MTRRAPSLESAVARARQADILGVAERLGVGLKKAGGEWVGPCPRCGGCDRFAINAGKQIFNCRRCCVGGDAIAFAGFVSGSSFAEAVALINDDSSTFTDKSDGKQPTCRPVAPDDRTAAALRIWAETSDRRETLLDDYLASRKISFPSAASLRFHPDLKHPSGSRWPAMVALVTNGESGEPVAIHRTYLARNGKGKAPVEPQKMMLGPTRGGAVRLSEPGETLAIGEGLESCLSVMQATGISTWAALSTSGLKTLSLPPNVRDVIVIADGDDAGERAAQLAARRWKNEGRRVRIARPPRGMDFNDIARCAAAAREVA